MPPQAAPSAPPAPAAKCSPPSAEDLCLKTFCACWFLNKDWLVSFIVSAQHLKPDAPITWVEFVPKGHTHLVRCALKLVPPTCALPLAKIKECIFSFILEVLNGPGSSPGFFTACKVGKPRKRTCTRKGKGSQPVNTIAVDTPDPSTAATGSTREPEAPTPLGAGDGDPPPLEGSSEPSAHTQHFPGPSSEESRDGGSSSEDPCASCSSTLAPPALVAPVPLVALALSVRMRKLLQAREKEAQWDFDQSSQSPSPVPSITSILGKCSPSPPPPVSPPPVLGSPVVEAALDWHAWMQHKRATYLWNNLGKSAPEKVTPLDLRDVASAAAAVSPLSPFPTSPTRPGCAHLPLSPSLLGCLQSPKSAPPPSVLSVVRRCGVPNTLL